MDQMTGLGILIVLCAIVVWLLCYAIRDRLKQAARLPVRQHEWHESLVADDDERRVTVPTAVVASIEPPRWEREVREILGRMEMEEVDAGDDDMDWCTW